MPVAPHRLFSLEFFPPRTAEGIAKLRVTRRQVAQLKPAFCSVTFGAGGSTREGTLATALEFRADGMEAVPHISCMGGTRESLAEVLTQYQSHGIRHLVALRGDLPSGAGAAGEFRYASELVAFIRQQTGDWFHIDVAAYPECHPQARSLQEDLAATVEHQHMHRTMPQPARVDLLARCLSDHLVTFVHHIKYLIRHK